MSTFEAVHADVVFTAETGPAKLGLEELRREFQRTTGAMSDEALRAAVAQERLDKAIARHGATSTQAKAATLRYRQEIAAVGRQSAVASVQVNHLERDVGKLGRGALTGTGLLHGLGRAAAFSSSVFLGGAGLVYAIRTATKAATEHGAAEAQLAAALRAQGINYAAYRGQIQAALRSQEQLSGFTESDVVPAFTKIVRTTGDVGKALKFLALSSDIARGSNVSLSSAANVVNKALAGQTTGLRRLGIEIPKGATATEALAIAQQKFAGSTAAFAKTAEGAQARLNVAIHNTEITIGQALLPTVTRLNTHLADWLDKSGNQERVQRDVNRVVKDGTAIVHGLVDAERLIAPPIQGAVKALGGLEHAVEIALVVGIALKARRAALSFGLIQRASALTRTQIVADAAIEEKALAGVGAAAASAGAAGAAGGAGGLALGVGAGAAVRGALAKGGRLLTKGGELFLVYKGLQFAIGSSPPTSQTGPNRYQGSNLGQDWTNFLSDAVNHPGRLASDLGKGLLNDLGVTNYGSSGVSGGPAALRFTDVYPAIAAGVLSLSGLAALKPRLSAQDYRALRLILEQQSGAAGRNVNVPGGLSGAGSVPDRSLSPAQTRAVGLARNPNDVGLLGQQAAYDRNALAFLHARFAAGKIDAAKYVQEYQALANDLTATEGQIAQINSQAASKRAAAAKKAAEAAAKARVAAIDAAVPESVSGSGSLLEHLFPGFRTGIGLPGHVGGSGPLVGRGFAVPIGLQVAAARAATTATNRDDIRAAKAIRDFARAAIRSRHLQGQALIDAFSAITQANSVIGTKASAAKLDSAAKANERAFLADFQGIVSSFAPNAFPRTGKLETHGFETVHELRQTNQHLRVLTGQAKTPQSRFASEAALAAFG